MLDIKTRRSAVSAILAAAPLMGLSIPSHAAQTMPPRQVLFEKAVTLPDNNVQATVVKIKFPTGYKTPVHSHKGPGPRYVLKGELKITEAGETNVYRQGDVFWESGLPMTAENIGNVEAEVVIFELPPVETGKGSKQSKPIRK